MASKNKPIAAPVAATAADAGAALQISCAHDGFRRAGMVFGRQPVRVELSDLTEAQIGQLKAEPLLTVIELIDVATLEA